MQWCPTTPGGERNTEVRVATPLARSPIDRALLALAFFASLVLLAAPATAQDADDDPLAEIMRDLGEEAAPADSEPAPTQSPAEAASESDIDFRKWTLDDLRAGVRVEVDGRIRPDGIVEAVKVVIEAPDDLEEVKGTISAIDYGAMTLTIPPFTILVTSETDIDDEDEEDSFDFEELQVGWHLEVDLRIEADGTLIAEEIAVDKVVDDDKIGIVEIEAFIDAKFGSTDDDNLFLVLLEQRVRIGEDTPLEVRSNVAGGGPSPFLADVDSEDGGLGLIRLYPWGTRLIVGGEVQLSYDLRDQYELDRGTNRDTATVDAQLTLQAEWTISNSLVFFLKGATSREEVVYDEDRDLETGESTRLTEAYVLYDIPRVPLYVQVGRQRFDDEKEWYYDAELDGARIVWNADPYFVEYSYSEHLRDNHLIDQFEYQIFRARWEYASKSQLAFHIIDIVDESITDQSPFYVGLAAVGRVKSDQYYVKYWGQYAYADGVTGLEELQAHAMDLGGAVQWRKVRFEPYVFGGYAWASGDDDLSDGTNEEFRQTGLQDNNDKVFGVASYRTYGELFRPELSNMEIWTLGAGIRPSDQWSVDVVWHLYSQDVASNSIRDSRLREDPLGLDRDLGMEFDIIVGGSGLWGGNWDCEIDVGYFIPGDAFGPFDDPATFVAVKLEYKF